MNLSILDYPNDWTQQDKLRLASELHMFKNDERYSILKNWLENRLRKLDLLNRIQMDDKVLHIQQGACRTLQDLLVMIETADHMFKQMKEAEAQAQRENATMQ